MNRGRAWQRAKSATKQAKADRLNAIRVERNARPGVGADHPPEKNWKKMYFRSNKLARAKQLGIDYPRKTGRELLAEHDVDAS